MANEKETMNIKENFDDYEKTLDEYKNLKGFPRKVAPQLSYKKIKTRLNNLKLKKSQTVTMHKKHDARFVVYKSLGMFDLNKTQFKELWSQKPEERGKVFVFGKEHDMPRFCKSYGKSYTFSNREHKADPIEAIKIDGQPFLRLCLDYLKKETGKNYNQILINWYPDHQSYIGAHSDDEKMFTESSVVCFNYCRKPRDIILKRKKKSKLTKDELPKMKPYKHKMENNTGYAMEGDDFQDMYTHEIPKRASDSTQNEKRISLTFRVFDDST